MENLRIETVAITQLVFDPTNARKHDQKNLSAIAGSLELFGQRKPIVVTPDNVVIAGNGTLEAAKSLGWSEIVVARTPAGWDWDKLKAFALADNRTAELAEWDAQILADQLLELDAVGYELATFGFESLQPPTDSDLEDAFGNLNKEESDLEQITFTLHKDQAQLIREALEASKALGEYGETGNQNSNGNAIARVCELWLGTQV
jgi:ParB-like chromosome segregation protein Spo0J